MSEEATLVTPDRVLRDARAMLEDPAVGDVTPSDMLGFAMHMSREDATRVMPEIERMRREHFAQLGQPVPTYPTRPRR